MTVTYRGGETSLSGGEYGGETSFGAREYDGGASVCGGHTPS